MKILTLFFLFLSLTPFSLKQKEQKASIYSRSYIVLESKTRKVLEGKDIHYNQSVASISKIMTAIIGIEEMCLDKRVVIDDAIDKAYGSCVYLKKGTEITCKDLLYGLMLRSGNDCALMIAKTVSNDVKSFVDLMNIKAKELKMKNTLFSNPHGLDEEDNGNISSSYDMALLQAYALKNDVYKEITSTKTYKSESYGVWINKNKLLNQYEFAISGKTGYTKKAKRTLVTSAKKDDLELIIVTLNCGGDFAYHKSLYEKNFSLYDMKCIAKKGILNVLDYQAYINEDLYYFGTKEEVENSKIYIEIAAKDNVIEIYIVRGNTKIKRIYIGECQKLDNPQETLLDKISKWFKNLFGGNT